MNLSPVMRTRARTWTGNGTVVHTRAHSTPQDTSEHAKETASNVPRLICRDVCA